MRVPLALLALVALPGCEPYGYGYSTGYSSPGYAAPAYGGYEEPYYGSPGYAAPSGGVVVIDGDRRRYRDYDRREYDRREYYRRERREDRPEFVRPQAAAPEPPRRFERPAAPPPPPPQVRPGFVAPTATGGFNPANPTARGGSDN